MSHFYKFLLFCKLLYISANIFYFFALFHKLRIFVNFFQFRSQYFLKLGVPFNFWVPTMEPFVGFSRACLSSRITSQQQNPLDHQPSQQQATKHPVVSPKVAYGVSMDSVVHTLAGPGTWDLILHYTHIFTLTCITWDLRLKHWSYNIYTLICTLQ